MTAQRHAMGRRRSVSLGAVVGVGLYVVALVLLWLMESAPLQRGEQLNDMLEPMPTVGGQSAPGTGSSALRA
jgi:hypothetical protein